MAYLGNSPIHRLYSTPKITLTQGQTVVPVKYTPGLALFFKNGVLLHPGDDYTATNGSTLTLATPAFEGDILQGVNLAWFAVANALTTFGGELEGELTGPSSASETKAGLVKLATTSQAQALTDDTTIITPKKLAGAFGGVNQALSPTGYQKLPGGLIIQWGLVQCSASGPVDWTYPLAFPNQVLCVGPVGVLASFPQFANITGPNLVKVSVSAWDAEGTRSPNSVFMLAIGY